MVLNDLTPWQLVMLAGLLMVALLTVALLMAVTRRSVNDRRTIRELENELDEGFRAMQAALNAQSLGQREEQLRTLQAIGDSLAGLINRGKNKYDVINAINPDRFFEAVRAFAKSGAGIELNGACFGPTWQEHKNEELCLYRIAKQAGCKFYLGSDAHMQEKMLRIVEVLPEVVEALGLTDADRFCLE